MTESSPQSAKAMPNNTPGFWSQPLHDYLQLLERILQHRRWPYLAVMVISLLAGWWLYVPIHELLHAFGCIWSGGTVTRLELSPEYGAAWLQQYFAWIAVGSEYAGQLTGFDTRGSDSTYLITVLLPYLLTIFPGVWLWHSALSGNWQHWQPWARAGFSVALIIAPFISIIGDLYEAASILVSRLAHWFNPHLDVTRWRSDDVIKLVSELVPEARWSDALGVTAGLLLSVVLCWLIYWLGVRVAAVLPGTSVTGTSVTGTSMTGNQE